MENILGVTQHMKTEIFMSAYTEDSERYDVREADALDEEEGSDRARLRYQRMFWESIPEAEGQVC